MSTKVSIEDRLNILGDSARFDVACSYGGNRKRDYLKLVGPQIAGIYPVVTGDGRCMPLLKVLMTNRCENDCAYCVNRASNDTRRTAFTPDELAELTIDLYKKRFIQGLFLSSGVVRNPDHTMELMLQTARLLRRLYGFDRYIHLKVMPSASVELIDEACKLADRVSVNVELPTNASLALVAPQKTKESIFAPMRRIRDVIESNRDERKTLKNAPRIAPSGQTTQVIVGASPESDLQILKLSDYFYRKMSLKRVYYSAFERVNDDPRLPVVDSPPYLREHRLYQADWLLRFYGFGVDELLSEDEPFLDGEFDPKMVWAMRNLHLFPVDVNKADYEMLLRVPGIGVKSAKRILKARRLTALDLDDLKKLGAVTKRAKHFLTSNGKYLGDEKLDVEPIKKSLQSSSNRRPPRQPSLFDEPALASEAVSTATGEL